MNDINVYVDAEDNINIKDDKQIIKLQVRFEDLTESQKQQLKGEKGDPLRFEDLTESQKQQLKGEKGDPLRFEDLTESQKQQLKGEKGDPLRFEDLTESQKQQLKGDPGPAPDTSEFMVKDELEQIIIELRKINGGN
jgi:hypothetical protein